MRYTVLMISAVFSAFVVAFVPAAAQSCTMPARMESFSDPMEITLCEDMYDLIRGEFDLTDRGEAKVKGFGKKRLYKLEGGRGELTLRSEGLFPA